MTLAWADLLDECSRLHTSRTRPEGPWENAALREDAQMLDIWVSNFLGPEPIPAVVVPTRMHEPGFYVRAPDGALKQWALRSPQDLEIFHRLVDAGYVSRRPVVPE